MVVMIMSMVMIVVMFVVMMVIVVMTVIVTMIVAVPVMVLGIVRHQYLLATIHHRAKRLVNPVAARNV